MIKRTLIDAGLMLDGDKKKRLVELVSALAASPGTTIGEAHFAKYPSYIPAKASTPRHQAVILVDIGGTSTKVGVRLLDSSGACQWWVLFESPNESFQIVDSTGGLLHQFADSLAQQILDHLAQLNISTDQNWSLGIVWSCAMTNELVEPTATCATSIAGIITDRKNYSKGEWFNRDTKDGDNVAAPFLAAFARNGLKIHQYLVANDTPLTMKALADGDSGMVASTGLNATIVEGDSDQLVICNAEMGVSLILPDWALSKGDCIAPNSRARTIEQVVAGKFLPQIFVGHILELGRSSEERSGIAELKPLATHLQNLGEQAYTLFGAQDIGRLTYSPDKLLKDYPALRELLAPAQPVLVELANAIVDRSSFLAALIAYGSIYSQLSRKSVFKISLDSRLAREIPRFNSAMRNSLQEIMPKDKNADLVLVDRLPVSGGVLSVPMQGAANALDGLA